MSNPENQPSLDGSWTVERRSGILPPFGVAKRIYGDRGTTLFLGIPLAFFRVNGRRLDYIGLPVVDELEPGDDGSWDGRGRLGRWEFARFRLTRRGSR